jgi:hypothetical protein
MAMADSNYTTNTSALSGDPLVTKSTHESKIGDCGGVSSVSRRSVMNTLVSLPIVAAMPGVAPAMSADDSVLLKLEEQIFEQYEGATINDDEIYRVHAIWYDECKRLHDEATREIIEGRTP